MKKLLVAIFAIAMTSTNAFADHHEGMHGHSNHAHKSMVRFTDFSNGKFGSLGYNSQDEDDNESSSFAINYAYDINGMIQIGGHYMTTSADDGTNEDEMTAYGLDFFYNFQARVVDTYWVALHYTMAEDETAGVESDMTTIGLEAGYRYNIHNWGRLHLTYSPSISYDMMTTEQDNMDDVDTNSIAFNFLQFDLLF